MVLDIDPHPDRRVLVTGANGFMGTHMANLLLNQGYWPDADVVFTDVSRHPSPPLTRFLQEVPAYRPRRGSAYEPCDLTDPDQVARLVEEHGPFTHVLHIAGLFDYAAPLELLTKVNVDGTVNLMNALVAQEEKPEHVVLWGAGGVYDLSAPTKPGGINENCPIKPSADYLSTKLEGERAAMEIGKANGVPVASIRPGGVYGPYARYGVGMALMIAARGGMGPFYFGPKNARAGMVHAGDVCLAGLFVAERPEQTAYEAYNVNDDSTYTMYELTRVAASRLGFRMLPVALPFGVMVGFVEYIAKRARKNGRAPLLTVDMAKFQAGDTLLDASKLKALGWRPMFPDAVEGMKETLDWYRKEGWL